MRIALVADLHGNVPATLSVQREIERLRVDEIWFLGDAVGKGPGSAQTCDWVREHCTRAVGGNWDYGISRRQFSADQYFWDQLGEERMAYLSSLPAETEATISGIRFRFFHGRPLTPLLFAASDKREIAPFFHTSRGDYGAICFADSHRPFFRTLDEGYYINTGSVGNSMGVPRAHFLLLEGELNSPGPAPLLSSIISVPYDNEAAAELARRDDRLPHRDAYVTEVLTGVYSR